MITTYLVFPRIEAQNFNANAGAYVAGVPQPTAICGLVHAFCLAWQRNRPGELGHPFASALYAVSQFSGLQGQSRNPKSMHSQKSTIGGSPSAPMTDRPRASMEFSLVLELNLAQEAASDDATMLHALTQTLESLRLCGGSLWVRAGARLYDTKAKALSAVPSDAFVLSDETHVLRGWLSQQPDLSVAQALADLCARPKAADEYKPRYVPLVAGLHKLTEFAPLSGARNGYAHAYAEPVIGLGRFRSIASVRRAYRLAQEAQCEPVEAVMPDGVSIPCNATPGVFWTYASFPLGEEFHLVEGY